MRSVDVNLHQVKNVQIKSAKSASWDHQETLERPTIEMEQGPNVNDTRNILFMRIAFDRNVDGSNILLSLAGCSF